MSALREVDFPKRGAGYRDVSKADAALHHAAKLWLIDSLDIFENDVRLPAPRIVHARVALPYPPTWRMGPNHVTRGDKLK